MKSHREDIFREIDSFIPNHEPLLSLQFIADAIFTPSPEISTSTHEIVAVECEDINETVLVDIIRNKEQKLKQYIADSNNKNLKEYWLVINFGFEEKTDLREYYLPRDFQSTFRRIYLVDHFHQIQIL